MVRIRGPPVHALAERPADVVRGAAAQLDGSSTGMGAGAVPGRGHAGDDRRLTQAGARPIAWTPAISALPTSESLKVNDEPLDDPRALGQLPELVAADIEGRLASLDRVASADSPPRHRCATSCASSTRRRSARCSAPARAPGHLHSRATWQEIDFWVSRCGLPAVRAIRAATHDAATALGVGHQSGAISPARSRRDAVRGDVLARPGAAAVGDVVIKRRPPGSLDRRGTQPPRAEAATLAAGQHSEPGGVRGGAARGRRLARFPPHLKTNPSASGACSRSTRQAPFLAVFSRSASASSRPMPIIDTRTDDDARAVLACSLAPLAVSAALLPRRTASPYVRSYLRIASS